MNIFKSFELYVSALFKLGKIERIAKHADFVAEDALRRTNELRADLDGRSGSLQQRTNELRADLDGRSGSLQQELRDLSHRLSQEVQSETRGAVRDLALRHSELAANYTDLTHRLDRLLAALAGAPERQAPTPAMEAALDGEGAFREALAARLAGQSAGAESAREDRYLGYLPELEAAVLRSRGSLPEDLPVMDLGGPAKAWAACLARSDLPAAPAPEGDPLAALTAMPGASLSALTALDLAPDWPLETLISITRQAARVLAPGGLFLLETPNPETLTSGLYDRLSEARPVTAPVLTALFDTAGFTPVETRLLDPDPRLSDLLARPGTDAALATQIFGPRRLVFLGERPLAAAGL